MKRSFYGRKEMKELGKKVELNIKATMDERWVNDFCSMLNWMQRCGELGHSSVVAFYSDGDGDFRPSLNSIESMIRQVVIGLKMVSLCQKLK